MGRVRQTAIFSTGGRAGLGLGGPIGLEPLRGTLAILATALLRRMLALIAAALLGALPAFCQDAALRGRVVDAETGEALPGVNVFVDQTTRGAATGEGGRYEIGKLAPGSYRIVASVIGYAMETVSVEVVPERSVYEVDFRLRPTVLELEAVEVESERPRGWQRNFDRFEAAFLGRSDNARATEILNPYVLDFEMQAGMLEARASAPLEIENRALGYRLTFVLVHFREGRQVAVGGLVFFRELDPSTEEEAARWTANRESAYRGSLTHLFRSLVEGNLRREGFYVAHDVRAGFYRTARRVELELAPVLEGGDRPYLYRLFFDGLHVEYGRQISRLVMTRDDATLHEDGYVYASAAELAPIAVYGDLSRRRMADLLPRDYKPGERADRNSGSGRE